MDTFISVWIENQRQDLQEFLTLPTMVRMYLYYYIHIEIYLQFSSKENPVKKISIANHSRPIAFSYMHKAFRPIRRDSLLKYTTDFVQQVQVPCQKCKRIHEIWIFWNVIWRPQYVNEQEKKNTRAKTTTDVKLLI